MDVRRLENSFYAVDRGRSDIVCHPFDENPVPQSKNVLIVGLQPKLINFSEPDYAAFPGLNAQKVQAGLDADAIVVKVRHEGWVINKAIHLAEATMVVAGLAAA